MSAQTIQETIPQENSLLVMYEFILPEANVRYKPESSFEKPLPVPEPAAAKLWLRPPAVPAHSLGTSVLLAHVGTDSAQMPTGT